MSAPRPIGAENCGDILPTSTTIRDMGRDPDVDYESSYPSTAHSTGARIDHLRVERGEHVLEKHRHVQFQLILAQATQIG